MMVIPLQAVANQSFSVPLDGNQWDITIKSVAGAVGVTLYKNGVIVVKNARAVGGMRIIQSRYQEDGNFAFLTKDFEIPDYTQFGASQSLVFISAAELALLRVTPPAPLTPEDFDPNGALPLRLFPQGYTLAT